MVFNDSDLGMPPFVAITEADKRAYAEKLAANELPEMPYGQRVWIAYYTTEHPGWDGMRIHDQIAIEHDVTVPLYLIEAFLATLR